MVRISNGVEVAGIKAKLDVDITGYNTGIEKAKAKVEELGAQGKKSASDLKAVEAALAQIGTAKDKIGHLTNVLDNINAKADLQRTKLAALKEAYDNTFNENKKLKLEEQILNTESALLRLMEASDKTSQQIWELEDSIESANAALAQMADESANVERANDALDDTADSAEKAEKNIKSLAVAYGALSAAMLAVIVKAVDTSAQFEQSMSRVKAITGATSEEFEKLRNKAAELGASTVYTASQAAEGMSFLAMAGFKTKQILETMPAMLNLAAAGQMDLARTAEND